MAKEKICIEMKIMKYRKKVASAAKSKISENESRKKKSEAKKK